MMSNNKDEDDEKKVYYYYIIIIGLSSPPRGLRTDLVLRRQATYVRTLASVEI